MKIIIPHLGLLGGNPYDFLNAFKGKDNIFFDSALASQDTILDFVKTLGPHRVLFGSDVPFGTMKSELSKILSLSLSKADKKLLLSENFIRLTGVRL
jgi:predicted TIM-barrel fold metal-dependent hydrolase